MQLVNEADGGGWTMSIDDRYGTMVFTMAGEAVAFAIFEVPLDARAGDGADDHFSFRRQANCSALEFSAGKRSQRGGRGKPGSAPAGLVRGDRLDPDRRALPAPVGRLRRDRL